MERPVGDCPAAAAAPCAFRTPPESAQEPPPLLYYQQTLLVLHRHPTKTASTCKVTMIWKMVNRMMHATCTRCVQHARTPQRRKQIIAMTGSISVRDVASTVCVQMSTWQRCGAGHGIRWIVRISDDPRREVRQAHRPLALHSWEVGMVCCG